VSISLSSSCISFSFSPWLIPGVTTHTDQFDCRGKMAQNTTQTAQMSILILGGSYGGVGTAHYLLKHAIPQLPDKESYQVIIVSSSAKAMCRPSCPRAMISDDLLPMEKVFVSIAKQFEQYPKGSFRFIHGTATEFDHTNRSVSVSLATGATEKLAFHALVIATGASTRSPLFGLNRDDEFLRASWASLREALPNAKSIAIAGAGPTGIETAGELGEYLNGRARWFSSKLEKPKVTITVLTADSKILPVFRPAVKEKAERLLAKVGVTIVKNTRITAVSPEGAGTEAIGSKATLTLESGKTLEVDLYIPATGTTPNTNFIDKSLLAADGRVETNPSTLRVDKAGRRIYAVGDVATVARPAVHLVTAAIPVLCANIKRDLLLAAGKDEVSVGEDRAYKEDTRETHFVPIGTSKGVGVANGYELPSLMVWLLKGRDYWLWTTENTWNGKQWNKAS
jgi:apoptosis-inducing factor 2